MNKHLLRGFGIGCIFAAVVLFFINRPKQITDEEIMAKAKSLGMITNEELVERLKEERLDVELLGRGYAWLDTGTMDSLVEAASYVQIVSKRQNIVISAPEEIAYKYGWISRDELLASASRYGKSPYGEHLKAVAEGRAD